ncbi:hypothetical protein Tco_0369437 [Tanacetum coccineum]
MSGEEPAPQMTPVESPHMVSSVKLPILKKGEYTLWSMRMEQYLTNTNYRLWQVIMNGDEPVQTPKDENGVKTEYLQQTQNAIVQDTNSSALQDYMIMSVFDQLSEQMSNHVTNWDKANQETKTVNESLTTELEDIRNESKILNKDKMLI